MREDLFLEDLTRQLETTMQEANSKVLNVICSRLKRIGELSPTDAVRLANMAKREDLNLIESIISDTTGQSLADVEEAIRKAAKYNDDLMEQYYKAKNLTADFSRLDPIVNRAIAAMQDGFLNLADTTAFLIDGKRVAITDMYRQAVNTGVYATSQGLTDYYSAIRGIVAKMAESGLRKVVYDSGATRRLDSAARMNLLDGVRQMNMEYRAEQGRQFGADGVEISAHGLCAPDHIPVQGRQYSIRDFARLQETLERPIGTCNCYHSTFPVILGMSSPAHTHTELRKMEADSNRKVTYKDKLGNGKTRTAYEATQIQRQNETAIRRLKDKRNAFKAAGDEEMAKKLNRDIKKQTAYYRQMSSEVNLPTSPKRIAVVSVIKS